MRLLRLLLPLAFVASLTHTVQAQTPYQGAFEILSDLIHQATNYTEQQGGTGPSTVMGTNGPDKLTDPAKNDNDTLIDNAGGSDGVHDLLDARDGDSNDVMLGGPEDTYFGDPEDKIVIVSPTNQVLWRGTVKKWKWTKAMLEWTKYRWSFNYALLLGVADDTVWTEHDVLALSAFELMQLRPFDDNGDGLLHMADDMPVGSYTLVPPQPSPGAFLYYMPSDIMGSTPLEDLLDTDLTPEEWELVRDGVLDLLAYAYAQPVI